MPIVQDTFQRSNSGGNSLNSPQWLTPFPFSEANVGSTSGGIQVLNNAFAPLSSGGDSALTVWLGQTFGNDQWAQATIAAIAAFTSQVSITACSSAAGTSTYTYTLTSGAALIVNQQIYVTGMTNAGNNSPTAGFKITALGSGTFSVANASPGANETGSTGVGKSPSDSNCGVAVRVSADAKTGYFLSIGTNSGAVGGNGVSADHRVYDVELWKVVSGTATFITQFGQPINTITDAVGDIYTLAVKGTTLTVWHNSTLLITATDSSIASGSPGLFTWSVGSPGEWANPTVYTVGNSGTQWDNFLGSDNGYTQVAADNFTRANENPLSDGGAWTKVPGATVNNLQLVSNLVEGTGAGSGAFNAMYWNANPFTNDQYSQQIVNTISTNSPQGPIVRVSTSLETFYYLQVSQATSVYSVKFFKVINGTVTQIGNTVSNIANPTGKVALLVVIGTTLMGFIDGSLLNMVTGQTDITSGAAGLMVQWTNSVTSCIAGAWSAGNVVPVTATASVGGGGSTSLGPGGIGISGDVFLGLKRRLL